jgi:ACS family D-galactonate transporter-like MFS transporter
MSRQGVQPQTGKRAWVIVALLFLFTVINFADKSVVGIAAVPIMRDLGLSPREFGLVGSSFFLLFAVSAIATGFLVNRIQTRWVLLAMGVIWALTQFPMMGAAGFGTLIACRIVLGAGEGPAIPVALHSTYKWFPNALRTLPTSIIVQGGALGVLITVPLLNWTIVHYSWHWAFGALGIAGLAWCVLWLAFGGEGTLVAAPQPGAVSATRIGYGQLLLNPTILATWAATFGAQWALSLALSWQGAFLIKGLGFQQGSIGFLGPLPAGASAIVLFAAGWYSQRLMARGTSSRLARGVLGGAGVALGGAALAIMPFVPGIPAKIALVTLGVALPSVIYVISNAIVGEIAPPAQRGALLAIGTAVGSLGGALAPYVMGSVIQSAATPLAGFYTGYLMCGLIMIAGGIIAMALIDPEREAGRWATTATPPLPA